MGKIKHLTRVRDFMRSTPVFRVRDVELIVGNKEYSYLILHNLLKKGEIRRVTKGWYTLHEDPVVSVFCFKPAYIGLQEALSFRDLWEQETNVVIVTTRRIRTGIRKFLDNNVILHRIDQKYFFGFDYLKYENFFVPVSDAEKSLIDLVYFNETPGKDVLRELKRRTNGQKLEEYLEHFPLTFKEKMKELV